MKQIFTILLCLPFLGMAQGAQGFTMNQPAAAAGFVIKGNLKGIPDNTDMALKDGNTGTVIVTGKIVKESFTMKGKLAEPSLLILAAGTDQQMIDLFISNDAVTITGDWSDKGNIKIKGSATQTDYETFKTQFNPQFEPFRNLVAAINTEKELTKRDSMMKMYTGMKNALQATGLKFIKERPGSPVSALALGVIAQMFDNPSDLEMVYARMQPSAKKNAFAKQLEFTIASAKQKAEDAKIGAVGSQALEFTQKDVDGKPVSLASFRGKYVLVDFWASWCRPCRAENPNVVNAYQAFKNKNFTVLGISLDQVKPNWVEAIKADNLTWTHVSDLQYWNNAVAQLYHIQSIPANLLIDPTGKIIARDIRGEELQRKLTEILK